MSKTIWKYRLPKNGRTIEINEHIVKVLHIANQDGVPTLWAIVDPEINPRGKYTEIVAWGTGWLLPDDVYQECDYLGSCEDYGGYIWHYFAATRFSDLWYADKITTDHSDPYNSPSAGSPNYPYSLTVSSDSATSASDWTIATLNDGPITAVCSSDNLNINLDQLIDMVEKYVTGGNTATNSACS